MALGEPSPFSMPTDTTFQLSQNSERNSDKDKHCCDDQNVLSGDRCCNRLGMPVRLWGKAPGDLFVENCHGHPKQKTDQAIQEHLCLTPKGCSIALFGGIHFIQVFRK